MNLQTFALHDCGAAPKRNFCTNYCPYTEREREIIQMVRTFNLRFLKL